jgi:aminoglycoside 6-adenylyltransferase
MTKPNHTQRSPETMFALILSIAEADERIRAVYLNGSRANPKIPRDEYQDFDVVFVVKETLPFINDRTWIKSFGDLALLQEPDRMDLDMGKPGIDFSKHYAWLMLFQDGNRIDLTLVSVEASKEHLLSDPLTVMLLDKDHRFPQLPPPNDHVYRVKPPTQVKFSACTNEFWWCLNNVGKGLAREETVYALAMLNEVVRPMLNRMVDWWIGTETEFSVNPGKYGKFYRQFLPPETYTQLMNTYCDSELEHMWKAVFQTCHLFEKLSLEVAASLALELDRSESENMMIFLNRVYAKPVKKSTIAKSNE